MCSSFIIQSSSIEECGKCEFHNPKEGSIDKSDDIQISDDTAISNKIKVNNSSTNGDIKQLENDGKINEDINE